MLSVQPRWRYPLTVMLPGCHGTEPVPSSNPSALRCPSAAPKRGLRPALATAIKGTVDILAEFAIRQRLSIAVLVAERRQSIFVQFVGRKEI